MITIIIAMVLDFGEVLIVCSEKFLLSFFFLFLELKLQQFGVILTFIFNLLNGLFKFVQLDSQILNFDNCLKLLLIVRRKLDVDYLTLLGIVHVFVNLDLLTGLHYNIRDVVPKISFHLLNRKVVTYLWKVEDLNCELFGLKLIVCMFHGVISYVEREAYPSNEEAKHCKLVNHYNFDGEVLLSNSARFNFIDTPRHSKHVE